tara:strand:+ start:597 stop:845 length:249 start_codon:yes stop_codon:yes gene_type:complete
VDCPIVSAGRCGKLTQAQIKKGAIILSIEPKLKEKSGIRRLSSLVIIGVIYLSNSLITTKELVGYAMENFTSIEIEQYSIAK